MRILFVSNLYPPNVLGGYERLCFEVASAFAGKGHEVSVLTSTFGDGRASYSGQSIHRRLTLLTGATIYQPFAGDAAARDAINHANIAALHDTVTAERPELVFSWNLFFLDRGFLEALTGAGLPVVVMLTDNWLANMFRPEFVAGFFRDHVFGTAHFPPPAPALPRPGLLGRLLRRTTPAPQAAPVLPVAAGAVFGAEFMRVFYRSAGFRFERERVIHNGVVQRVDAGAPFRDRRILVEPDCLRLLFAGRLVDLKGADTAVAALDRLTAAAVGVTRIRLTIVGDEQDVAYVERLRQAVAASAAGHEIVMQPTVAEDALFALFQAHDVYLFPSLYEPFSLTLIHALACGIPTVASDAGGNVEIVHHSRSGLLFGKGDADGLAQAIVALASDPELRVRVSLGGREVARRFEFAAMIEGMDAFLGDVVGR